MLRGFTLIEAMVVVAIGGIMASLAIGMGSEVVVRERARTDVELVRAHLVNARNHARRQSACVRVVRTSPTTLSAALFVDAGLGCPAASHAVEPQTPQTTLSVASSISTFSVEGVPTSVLLFRPDGSLPVAGPVVFSVDTGAIASTSLAVWPAAGIVKRGSP